MRLCLGSPTHVQIVLFAVFEDLVLAVAAMR